MTLTNYVEILPGLTLMNSGSSRRRAKTVYTKMGASNLGKLSSRVGGVGNSRTVSANLHSLLPDRKVQMEIDSQILIDKDDRWSLEAAGPTHHLQFVFLSFWDANFLLATIISSKNIESYHLLNISTILSTLPQLSVSH